MAACRWGNWGGGYGNGYNNGWNNGWGGSSSNNSAFHPSSARNSDALRVR